MNGEDWLWPLAVLAVGAVATYLPRGIGVFFSGRLDVNSPVLAWLACVAYALLAGLIARMILLPIGPLEETATAARVVSALVGVAVLFLTRRLLPGIAAGAASLALFQLWLPGI